MSDLLVKPAAKPLSGVVPVPGDKSITHRALMLAALSEGKSEVRSFRMGADNRSTASALRALGVLVEEPATDTLIVHGVGLHGLSEPKEPIDCGNSGTSMRLFAGLLVGQTFRSVLVGDESLSGRPMARIVDPLRARGATRAGA